MSQYRCIICGCEIEPLPGYDVAVCPNCETRQVIPGYAGIQTQSPPDDGIPLRSKQKGAKKNITKS